MFVLTKIDEILTWEKQKDAERDTRSVELGRYLCEVLAGQYWRSILGLRNRESGMTWVRSKQPRLRLDPERYEQLRNQVLRRDSWRCQSCGAMSNLEVHHKEFRSHCGEDSEQNLITLCSACHGVMHRS